ncbi:unnamed protein product [Echinostoma caproni]|uniref:Lipase_3 domain-containing protein n=1 Tax=Echinostoma caproni TaxID=27848 RepID=A0A183B783_9TREM|nr:unnamed protein product [Echinostoma caproni]
MFRMNFFVLGLCLVMNRDYLFYYFMPLVSFWFTVIFVFMIVFPRVNSPVATGTVSATASATPHPTNITSSTFIDTADTGTPGSDEPAPTTDLNSLEHTHPSNSAWCTNPPVDSTTATSRSTLYVQAQSASSTPRQAHRYESPASITECELVRHSRAFTGSTNSIMDIRGHHKARSVGALSDVRQIVELACLPRNPRSKPGYLKNDQPWPEDWLRRLRVLRSSTGWDSAHKKPRGRFGWFSRFRHGLCCSLRLADILIVIKLVILICGIEVLNRSDQLFQRFFFSGPQKRLFQLTAAAPNLMEPYGDDVIREEQFWYRRWSLDRYSVVYGMIFALFCEWARRAGWLDDTTPCDLGLIASSMGQTVSSNSVSSSDHQTLLPESAPKAACRFPFNGTIPTAPGMTTHPAHFLNAPFHSLGHGYNVFSRITCRQFTAATAVILGLNPDGVMQYHSQLRPCMLQQLIFCGMFHADLDTSQ